ncbi:hypothetical protein BJV77DRAFT_1067844 [Russula vinacea]|nr:hypothetical protein BJV77DRAFT_1067844 [Russula vinacea]
MLGLFGRTVFHMCPTKCLRTRHTSVTGPTSLPFQLIGPLSTPSNRIQCFIPFSLPRMLEHPPLSSSFRLAVVHISWLQTRHAFVTSSTLIHSQLLCTPSHAAGWLQPPFPPTMTTLCSFTISGFFTLTDGNRNNDLRRSRYDSALVCMNSPPIPAQVYTFNPSGVFLPDNTIAYLIGKAYYPPPGDCRPVVIETVEFVPIPGDPSSAYADNAPDFPYPAVSALGTVSSVPVPQQDGKVDFMITAQDYVCGGMKTSTIICRLDKTLPRWKNVPAPARLTQVAIVALCCENTPEDRLCVMVKSLNLPMGAPTLPLLSTPHDNEPTLKRPKFSAHAQPRRPPIVVVPRQVSRAVALSDSTNDLWHADLVSLPSSSHSLSVTLSS